MVLAGNRPDLRAVIVDNPGCSPELRAWVGRMGVVGSGRSGRSVVETDSIGGAAPVTPVALVTSVTPC